MAEKLREQVGYPYQQGIGMQPMRASAAQTHVPASRQYAGHYAGTHPEDTPYLTGGRPGRVMHPHGYNANGDNAGRNNGDGGAYNDDDDDDAIYQQRPATSTRRYLPPRQVRSGNERTQEVYTDGNRKIVVHREPLPKRRRSHWMLFVGIVLFVM